MTAPVRVPPISVSDPLEDFIARCETSARRWQAGYRDFHDAVDGLQAEADASGLVAAIGQDAVLRHIAEAFAKHGGKDAEDAWLAPSWREAAADYHRKRGNRRAIVEIGPERLDRLRRLMADDITLERAWSELNKRDTIPVATLKTAEWLAKYGEPERFRKFLLKYDAAARAEIQRHLKAKQCR